MKHKKKMLARLMYFAGAIQFRRMHLSNRLIVFNYHRIRPTDPCFSTPFDDGVFGPSRSEFRRQMEWLKRNARIISETDLLEYFRSGKIAPGMNALITFDDGYRDNYTLAYPVLRELGIPAILFIPTGMIQARRLGWWDITAFLIKKTGRREIIHNGRSISLDHDRVAAIRYFHSILRIMRQERIDQCLAELSEFCRVPLPDLHEQGSQMMDWNQIRTVSENGIAIGSHTHSHPSLATLSPEEQQYEMTLSGSILEEQTGLKMRSIAYPLGGYEHVSADTGRIAAEAGYLAGFSFNTGINVLKEIKRYDLKRICGPDDFYILSSSICFPNLFAWKKRGSDQDGIQT